MPAIGLAMAGAGESRAVHDSASER